MEDEGLLDLEDDILVKETQDTPNIFSKNLIKKLGICRNCCSGTEAVSLNNPSVKTGQYLYAIFPMQVNYAQYLAQMLAGFYFLCMILEYFN